MNLSIISPYTHLNGHYWPYTCDLISALAHTGVEFEVFAARAPRYSPVSGAKAPAWHACCPWTRLLLSDSYRAKHWGSRADNLFRNIEFLACLKKAKSRILEYGHLHCIESRHRILLKEVICSKHSTFSTLCVGAPSPGLSKDRADDYRRAFDTGRLTFIVETEAVREAWQDLSCEHVVHIPAALPWNRHQPVPQSEARSMLELPEDKTICLFFGTHRVGKDYETAIRAAKASSSQPFLLFAGPVISGNDPAALTASIGYRNSASWNGYFPDDKVPLLFDAADVVMLPYADNYTKGSAVLLQACHFRKPVIATNTGHLREFVELNSNGLLYASGSVQELADCYDLISSHKQAGSLDSKWSFETANANYSWDKLLPQYLGIFRSR